MSFFNNQYFFAGLHFKILSIFTHIGVVSTTAQIHSKSQESASLKLFDILLFINSLCLSQMASTIPDIAQSTKSVFFIHSKL